MNKIIINIENSTGIQWRLRREMVQRKDKSYYIYYNIDRKAPEWKNFVLGEDKIISLSKALVLFARHCETHPSILS